MPAPSVEATATDALDREDLLVLSSSQEEGGAGAPPPEAARGSLQVPSDIHHDEQQQQEQSQNQRRRRHGLLLLLGVLVLAGALAAAIAIPLAGIVDNKMNNDISEVKEQNQDVYNTTTDSVARTELQQHAAEDDCWVAFYGTVYDMTEYAPTHPGWAAVIYNVCGQDGTSHFEHFHPPSYLDGVSQYVVGELVVQEGAPLATPTPVLSQPETDPSTPTLIPQEPIDSPTVAPGERIDLPAPATSGGLALTESLAQRRSVRSYSSDDSPLNLTEISQLLWAAQGETSGYKRTAPSAGALYPLELYLVTASGFYHYHPDGHYLTVLDTADLRPNLSDAALAQEPVAAAPAVFVLAGVYERTEQKYGGRAERYVHMEAGHAGQNLLLQAVGIGLGAVPIGAFDDGEVQAVLGLAQDHKPLYVIPVGRPQQPQQP